MSYIRCVATVSTANASNSDPARSQPRLLHSKPIILIFNRRLEASDHKSILRLAPSITSPLCQLHLSLSTRACFQTIVCQSIFYLPSSFPRWGPGNPLDFFPPAFCLLFSLKWLPLALLDLAHVHRDHTPQAARRLLGRCCWAEMSAGSPLKHGGRSNPPGMAGARYSD